MESYRRIASETSDSTYTRSREGVGKTVIVNDEISVEYN